MALSYDLISQFAKLATPNTKSNNGTTIYGTVGLDDDGNKFVTPDGSNQKIPVDSTSTVTNVDVGNRVSVLIKDHTAIVTGNISSPSATTGEVIAVVQKVQANEGYFKSLIADEITLGILEAAGISVTELLAKEADIHKLIADGATITDLIAKKIDADVVIANYAKAKDLEATNAEIDKLVAKDAEIVDLVAEKATIKDLDAEKVRITNLETDTANFKKATAETLEAQLGRIETLEATDANLENVYAEKAVVEELSAKVGEIGNLNAKYADIDFTNINEAAIRRLFSDTGLIKDLVVGDQKITGELVGVTIIGDYIKVGTVQADKLVVKGSDGLYYKLNVEAGGVSAEEAPTDSLHGSVITAKSITAEKVSVQDLVAFGATIGGFHITDNAIYSGAKGSVNADSIQGLYMDSTGQFALGDENNFLKYYKDPTDGKYKLEIAADYFKLSSGKTLEESVTENLEIGARNLIRNSKTMIFADYYFEDRPSVTDTAVLGAAIIGTMILGKET